MNTKLKKIISEAGKTFYSRGEWHNSNDNKGGSPIRVTKWDALVDEYNDKHGYSTSTKSNSRAYESEIGNLSAGMEWKVAFRNGDWKYQLYNLGQLANIFRNLDELISHFKDNNGGNDVSEIKTENTLKLNSLLQENMHRFGTKNIAEQTSGNEELQHQIITALYDVIAKNQNSLTGIDVIDDMLETDGEAKAVANSQMMPLVKQLTPIINYLIKRCDKIEYKG